MSKLLKKLSIFMLILLSLNVAVFAKDKEEMSLLELNKTILTLKYEIYQIDHRFGDFEEMNGLKLKFEKSKRERQLKKLEPELKERNAENAEKAKEAASQAAKELEPTFKKIAEKSKDLGKKAVDAVGGFFSDLANKAEESGFWDNLKNFGKDKKSDE